MTDKSTGYTLDKKINLANLMAIGVIVVGALAFHFRMEASVEANTVEIAHNKEAIKVEKQERRDDRKEIIDLLKDIAASM